MGCRWPAGSKRQHWRMKSNGTTRIHIQGGGDKKCHSLYLPSCIAVAVHYYALLYLTLSKTTYQPTNVRTPFCCGSLNCDSHIEQSMAYHNIHLPSLTHTHHVHTPMGALSLRRRCTYHTTHTSANPMSNIMCMYVHMHTRTHTGATHTCNTTSHSYKLLMYIRR